ncbi:MAG: flavin reductase family protein [Dehalococcoidia bacterium]|jgi:flavin reductase (DIM6/NTAB) family NADH-FMN oxidoreductase RutF
MAKKEIMNACHLYPMPLVLIGAKHEGRVNFMPAAFCGILNINPPIVALGLSKMHFTSRGIEENGVFSINLPSVEMVEATDYCGVVSGHKVDKSGLFKVFYGKLETAPMIEECRLNMECKLIQKIVLGVDTAYVGEIVATYCEDKYMDGKMPDIAKLNPLIFSMGDNSYWSIGKNVGKAWSIGKSYK